MGLTKQYLRWAPGEKFGVIGSPCNAIQLIHQWPEISATDRICATAACEDLIFWDTKTAQIVDRVVATTESDSYRNSPITCLAYNSTSMMICSGHKDGTVRLFDIQDDRKLVVIFAGHRGMVSCLTFDGEGLRIASGGKDTEIVIWDVASQSGMFRLKGHKGPINRIEFMQNHPSILISASNDTFIKFWDLDTQHCFKTLVGHRTEVWSFVLLKNDTRLISGGSESELKVWKIMFAEEEEENFRKKLDEMKEKRKKQIELLGEDEIEIEDDLTDNFMLVEQFGTILRKSSERVSNIFLDPAERILICHGKDNFAECFKIRDQDEIRQKMKKRLRKERKRQLDENDLEENLAMISINEDVTLSDEIEKLDSIKVSSKIRCLDLKQIGRQEIKVAFLLTNNSIECHKIILKGTDLAFEELSKINSHGHRFDVRTVSISSDNLSILTASSDSVKLWNKSSCRCINTISEEIEYPLCSLFVPGDKHAILGTKTGKLQIINFTKAEVQSTIEASENGQPIWSVCLLPDLTGIVSGCEDKSVKFWSFDLIQNEEDNSRTLTLEDERTLIADEGVICTKVSPNSKFVAVSCLDSCVKIYFCDTFKFFLSLYGHKFPVLAMDISSDNALIVTGSSDKNIKIWGMDFGDCHRSIFAHDDNIMCVAFVPKTHQFFTASKDQKIKMWDADNFEKIATLEGHHGEIWSMAIAPNGKYLVTAAHDKTIRIWNKTQEPLILEEEKEMEHEREFEREMDQSEMHSVVPGEPTADQETGMAQRKTSETIKSVEKLIESIDIYLIEVEKYKLYQRQCETYERKKADGEETEKLVKPAREPVNPHLMVYRTECPYRFMLEVLIRIKSNELEETLLQLPFYYVQQLLMILLELLQRRWEVELLCRCVCFLFRVNFGQISTSTSMTPLVERLQTEMTESVKQLDDLIGTNTAALEYFESVYESREEASLFSEAILENRIKKRKKQKKQSTTAPILTWN